MLLSAALLWPQGQTPGRVAEVSRPDLSLGIADRAPLYTPTRGFERHDLTFAGVTRHWSILAPEGPGTTRLPVVLLLHGSGRNGAAMLDMWQAIGAHDAILVAPDALDPRAWSPVADSPAFLAAVLQEVAKTHPSGPVYLYGHSAGGYYALYLAACLPGPWLAVAVHAGSLRDCAPDRRGTKIPALLQIGDQDTLVALPDVRQSAVRLGQLGHDVTLEVIPNHDHWFYAIGPKLAADAWAFFLRAPQPR